MSHSSQAAGKKAIATLAVLKVSWDEHRDYIANFLPLVAHCIRASDAEVVSVSEVQREVLDAFGLRIPLGVLQTLLHRAARDGLIAREHGVYRPLRDNLTNENLDPISAHVLRQHEHLVELLVAFASTRGRTWSRSQAEQALLAHIEALTEPILTAALEGTSLVELPKLTAEGSAVVGQFVLDLAQHEPSGFEYLETVVKGSMLSNVLYFPEAFSGGQVSLGALSVYLDTPIALRALGYAEEPYRVAASEMVDLLAQTGAKLMMFRHTRLEIEAVLASASSAYRRGRAGERPGDVVDYFAQAEMTESDVQAEIAALDQRLTNSGILVVETPPQTEALGVDEKALEDLLRSEVGYGRRETLLKDLDSLTAIHRLRRGELRRRIEHSDALLVTTNVSLCKAGRLFSKELHSSSGVPLCIVDSRLASLAWLMHPVQTTALPRKQIIAISYAAMNPTDAVWRKYLQEIRKLSARGELSDDQIVQLVYSPDARLELANSTNGDPDVVTEGTVPRILEHARQSAQAEVNAQLREERVNRAQAEDAAANERARAEAALASTERTKRAQEDHIRGVAHRLARGIGWIVFALAVLIAIGGLGFATTGLFPAGWSAGVPFLASALVVVFALAGFAGLVWGFSLKQIVDGTERFMHTKIERRLSRMLTPRPDAASPSSESGEMLQGDEDSNMAAGPREDQPE